MLVQPPDSSTGPDEWRPFVEANAFGHLVASGRDRDVAVVVPTQFVLDGDDVVLHLAAANPVWSAIAENPTVLLSVAGDWSYIPSWWKAIGAEDPALGIPTTYYAAVQLVGEAQVVDHAEDLATVLRAQLAELEPNGVAVDPLHHRRRFPAIRGLRIAVTGVTAKFKYGGNVDMEHRTAVADRLAERDGPGDRAARAHLLRRSTAADQS